MPKMLIKEKKFNIAREKVKPIRIIASFPSETLQAEGHAWCISSSEKNNCQSRLLYPAKISFRTREESRTVTTKPALQKLPKGTLNIEEEDKNNQKGMGKNKSCKSREANKMTISNTHPSRITLNVYDLNPPITSHTLVKSCCYIVCMY